MIKRTKEDYLRAIYHVQEEIKDRKSGVKSVDLCKYLKLSKSTVSEMLRKLMKNGFIEQPTSYGRIKLTKKGFSESVSITKKHRLIEAFLSGILKIRRSDIHDEAHRLEHAFSNDSINSIAGLIKDTKTCPHGKPIP